MFLLLELGLSAMAIWFMSLYLQRLVKITRLSINLIRDGCYACTVVFTLVTVAPNNWSADDTSMSDGAVLSVTQQSKAERNSTSSAQLSDRSYYRADSNESSATHRKVVFALRAD